MVLEQRNINRIINLHISLHAARWSNIWRGQWSFGTESWNSGWISVTDTCRWCGSVTYPSARRPGPMIAASPKLNVWRTWKLLKPTENGWLLLSTSSYFHLEGWKWTQIGQTEKKTEATRRAISSLWLQRLHSAASVKNLSEHKNSYIPQKLKETQDCQFAVC